FGQLVGQGHHVHGDDGRPRPAVLLALEDERPGVQVVVDALARAVAGAVASLPRPHRRGDTDLRHSGTHDRPSRGPGDLGIRGSGDPGIWGSGDLGIQSSWAALRATLWNAATYWSSSSFVGRGKAGRLIRSRGGSSVTGSVPAP